jgi:hypothetical protein
MDGYRHNIWQSDYYGVWLMSNFSYESLKRFNHSRVFDIGETIVVSEIGDNVYLTEISNIARFGDTKLYKSNYFDIEFDDQIVTKKEMGNVTDFIKENTRLFKPAHMEIRDIRSIKDYKLESNKIGD